MFSAIIDQYRSRIERMEEEIAGLLRFETEEKELGRARVEMAEAEQKMRRMAEKTAARQAKVAKGIEKYSPHIWTHKFARVFSKEKEGGAVKRGTR